MIKLYLLKVHIILLLAIDSSNFQTVKTALNKLINRHFIIKELFAVLISRMFRNYGSLHVF